MKTHTKTLKRYVQSLTRDMTQSIGAFPNQSQIAVYMGWGRDRTRVMLEGLEFIQEKKSKQYFVRDVAGRILEGRGI